MSISEKLSQQQLKELLNEIYIKGEESDSIQTKEMIMEIKQKLMIVLNT